MARAAVKKGGVMRLPAKNVTKEAAKRVTETLRIGGVEFVLVPKADLPVRAARGSGRVSTAGEVRVDASHPGRRLFDARRHVGLTQTELDEAAARQLAG
jgi:hypothetical protein